MENTKDIFILLIRNMMPGAEDLISYMRKNKISFDGKTNQILKSVQGNISYFKESVILFLAFIIANWICQYYDSLKIKTILLGMLFFVYVNIVIKNLHQIVIHKEITEKVFYPNIMKKYAFISIIYIIAEIIMYSIQKDYLIWAMKRGTAIRCMLMVLLVGAGFMIVEFVCVLNIHSTITKSLNKKYIIEAPKNGIAVLKDEWKEKARYDIQNYYICLTEKNTAEIYDKKMQLVKIFIMKQRGYQFSECANTNKKNISVIEIDGKEYTLDDRKRGLI